MPDNPDEFVKLVRVRFEAQAALLTAALEDRGVETRTEGGLISGFRAEAPGGVDIFVRRRDLERAQATLREIESSRA